MPDAEPRNTDMMKAKDDPEERIPQRDQMRAEDRNRKTPREAENEARGK